MSYPNNKLYPNEAILRIFQKAFNPCVGFKSTCHRARWDPLKGFIPRGLCGALAEPSDVKIIMVAAEPGDPHKKERYVVATPEGLILQMLEYSYECKSEGKDLFHRNIRNFIDDCFPGKSFNEQLKYVLFLESVFCSAVRERGKVNRASEDFCFENYVKPIIELCRNAIVVAFGTKAKERLHGIKYLPAGALAPPGCNFKKTKESWKVAAAEIKQKLASFDHIL